MTDVYTLDPHTIKFDDKYVIFNPTHSDAEYEATRANIKQLGQLDPILMLNGLCVDGRHRTKIAKELCIDVRCIDIDASTSEQDIIVMCNKNVMSGRDYDATQKAIQALTLATDYNMTNVEAARFMKVDRKAVSYAATIRGYNRDDLLEALSKDKNARVQLDNMDRPSRSLELIAKFLKALGEEKTVIIDDSERIQWKPDALIKTEVGKAWFYTQMDLLDKLGGMPPLVETEVRKQYVQLTNLIYKVAE